jgi:tetratricopeptide (TPR) repeat protein
LEKQGLLDDAIVAHRRAVEQQPKFPNAYFRLLEALTKAGRLEASLLEYEAKVRGNPDDDLSRYLLARVLLRSRRWEEAAGHLSQLLVRNAPFPELWAKRGDAYAALGRWEEATSDYAKDVELRPNAAAAHNALAWLLATCPDAKYRDPRRAVTAARRAVELGLDQATFWRTLGVAQYRAGTWRDAVQALEKARQLRPGGDGLAGFFLAMAQWQQGDKDQARQQFDEAAAWMDKNHPKDEEHLRFRAEAAELLKVDKK